VDDPDAWLIIGFLLCLALSAFFSSAESAFVSLSRLRIRYLVENNVKGAKKLEREAEHPEKFLATVLLGNNLVNIAAATLGTIMAVGAFGPVWGPVIATVVVTTLILIFGEVGPKTIAVRHAQKLSLSYINFIKALQTVFYPVITALGHIGSGFARIAATDDEGRASMSEDEIRYVISAGEMEGIVEEDEAKMLHKVFEFTDRPASKVMLPRTEIDWVEEGTTLNDFLQIYTETPHSRFPVYRDNTDNVIGILFTRDALLELSNNPSHRGQCIDPLVKPASFVPESKHLGDLLAEMRNSGSHMVMLVDEFGGVAGLTTLSQLTEEIVGEIQDDLTDEDKDFVLTGDNSYQLDGGFRVEEANEELELGLPLDDYETIAGFILSHLGRIPRQGEQLRYKNLQFVITEMRGVKIEKVMVTLEKKSKEAICNDCASNSAEGKKSSSSPTSI
jgi:putative hemolysin